MPGSCAGENKWEGKLICLVCLAHPMELQTASCPNQKRINFVYLCSPLATNKSSAGARHYGFLNCNETRCKAPAISYDSWELAFQRPVCSERKIVNLFALFLNRPEAISVHSSARGSCYVDVFQSWKSWLGQTQKSPPYLGWATDGPLRWISCFAPC